MYGRLAEQEICVCRIERYAAIVLLLNHEVFGFQGRAYSSTLSEEKDLTRSAHLEDRKEKPVSKAEPLGERFCPQSYPDSLRFCPPPGSLLSLSVKRDSHLQDFHPAPLTECATAYEGMFT